MRFEVEDYFVAPIIKEYLMSFRLQNPECNFKNPFKVNSFCSSYKFSGLLINIGCRLLLESN